MVTRGKATAGVVAHAMAGADVIEIKVTIPQHQVKSALKSLTRSYFCCTARAVSAAGGRVWLAATAGAIRSSAESSS